MTGARITAVVVMWAMSVGFIGSHRALGDEAPKQAAQKAPSEQRDKVGPERPPELGSPGPQAAEDPTVEAFRKLGGKFLADGFKSSWSPDGTRLVFGKQEAPFRDRGAGLSIVEVGSGKITKLTDSGKDPAWSPGEGRWIAYVDGGYGPDEQIWIIEPSGKNRRKLIDGGFPSWSPDGKEVYYHCRKEQKIKAIKVDAAEPEPKEILATAWWYPAFSPDGKRVAYRAGDRLILADCQTGETVKEYPIPGGRGFLGNWSPDGKSIGYGGYGYHDAPGLWILDVATGDLKQLSKGFFTMPTWSTDGSKLAVDLRLGDGFQVWMIDAKVLDSLEKIKLPRDRYEVPEGNVEELLKFIQDLRSFRPKSYQEYSEHRSKAPGALKSAAEKIMELEKDETSEAFQTAALVLLEGRVRNIARVSLAEKKQVLKELTDVLTKKSAAGLAPSDLSLAISAARALEYGNERELAAGAYERFAGLIADSNDEKMARYAKMLEGAARRLRLPGNELELKGTLLGGDEFDWAAYRGKVVLVDFWATWCGPCRAELPNVRKYYELYHERGFDVVGISLDRNRKALEDFLEKEKLPWVTLYEEDAEGSNPTATYYGVMAIPTVLLVDKEGKVVSLRARGEELGKLLKEQLGPVDEEKLREIEERMRQDARKPAPKTPPPAPVEPDTQATIGEGNAVYLACGPVVGPGKVYQVDGRGRMLGRISLPATAYGIDVREDSLVLAIPRGRLMSIGADGTISAIPGRAVSHPIDIAAHPRTGALVVADNREDRLVLLPAGNGGKPKPIQEIRGDERLLQNMSLAVSSDGFVLFATDNPRGVFRFPLKGDKFLGAPIIRQDGDVAADRSSNRWAAVTRSGDVRVFQRDKELAAVPSPGNRQLYLGGILAFGPDGTLVVAFGAPAGVELAQVDLEKRTFRTLFLWRGDRLVDFAVGKRMKWPRSSATGAPK